MRKIIAFSVFISLLFVFSGTGAAEEIAASGLSPTAIEAAIERASPGDTVVLPAGTHSGYYGIIDIPNGVSLRGSGINQTVLIHQPSNGPIFRWNINDSASSHRVEVHDFKLVGVGDASTLDKGIELLNDMKDFNVYNLHIQDFGDYGIMVGGDSRGVITNCNFIDCYTNRVGYGVAVYGDRRWDEPKPPLGTREAVFIEDCYFNGCKHAVASVNGSHYVFRHNQVEGLKHNKQGVDAHGKQDEHPSGSSTWEIYNNQITGSGSSSITDWGIVVRGGSGVIWGNTINGCDPGNPPKAIAISVDEFTSYPDPYQVRDAYIWDNVADGDSLDQVFVISAITNYVRLNREYFLSQKPGYESYAYPHPLSQAIERVCGDVNGDLSITATDAQMAFDIYTGSAEHPTMLQLENSDVNCDGTVDVPQVTPADAQAIFFRFLGRYPLPCDCTKYSRANNSQMITTRMAPAYAYLENTAIRTDQVVIEVFIESPLDIRSFGFDVEFPKDMLKFAGTEMINFEGDSIEIGVNPLGEGIVRVGGYNRDLDVLCFRGTICLAFQITSQLEDLDIFKLANPVDGTRLHRMSEKIIRTKHPNKIERHPFLD